MFCNCMEKLALYSGKLLKKFRNDVSIRELKDFNKPGIKEEMLVFMLI